MANPPLPSENKTFQHHQTEEPNNSGGVATTTRQSDRGSTETTTPSFAGSFENSSNEQHREVFEDTGDNFRSGHREGVPFPGSNSKNLIARITEAFQEGDPSQAWEASQELIQTFQAVRVEAAKLRFRLNFGTSVCERCKGLVIEPGVVATCFQIKQCEYKPLRLEDLSTMQKKFLDL